MIFFLNLNQEIIKWRFNENSWNNKCSLFVKLIIKILLNHQITHEGKILLVCTVIRNYATGDRPGLQRINSGHSEHIRNNWNFQWKRPRFRCCLVLIRFLRSMTSRGLKLEYWVIRPRRFALFVILPASSPLKANNKSKEKTWICIFEFQKIFRYFAFWKNDLL